VRALKKIVCVVFTGTGTHAYLSEGTVYCTFMNVHVCMYYLPVRCKMSDVRYRTLLHYGLLAPRVTKVLLPSHENENTRRKATRVKHVTTSTRLHFLFTYTFFEASAGVSFME